MFDVSRRMFLAGAAASAGVRAFAATDLGARLGTTVDIYKGCRRLVLFDLGAITVEMPSRRAF